MANTPKKLAQALLTGSDAAIFTGVAGHYYTISEIVICNTDGTDLQFDLHDVDAAGSSSDTNALFKTQWITANSTLRVGRGWVLTGAAMLRGLASVANKIAVTVYGIDTA